MDLEEWEILPDDGFLEIHDDGGKKIFSRRFLGSEPKIVLNTNYFTCPSPNSRKIADPPEIPRVETQFLPVPIELKPVKVVTDFPIETAKVKAPNSGAVCETDQKAVSQVFFNKAKETEFVDMKMDSPRSGGRGIVPQIDAGAFQFEDKSERKVERETEAWKNRVESDSKETVNWERENAGVKILKWSLSGIGAICSFGVAAATICIIVLGNGNHQRNNKQQNHKIQFQIYTDEKRMKGVVHHATNLNEAISAVRGVPRTRAQFTYGGYYDHRL